MRCLLWSCRLPVTPRPSRGARGAIASVLQSQPLGETSLSVLPGSVAHLEALSDLRTWIYERRKDFLSGRNCPLKIFYTTEVPVSQTGWLWDHATFGEGPDQTGCRQEHHLARGPGGEPSGDRSNLLGGALRRRHSRRGDIDATLLRGDRLAITSVCSDCCRVDRETRSLPGARRPSSQRSAVDSWRTVRPIPASVCRRNTSGSSSSARCAAGTTVAANRRSLDVTVHLGVTTGATCATWCTKSSGPTSSAGCSDSSRAGAVGSAAATSRAATSRSSNAAPDSC